MVAAYLLIVTGIYTGSMAPGVDVAIRMEARDIASQHKCERTGVSMARTLTYLGATQIETRCEATP